MRRFSLVLAVGLVGCTDEPVEPIHDVDCVGTKCDDNAMVPGVAEKRVFPRLTFNLPVQMIFSPADKTRAYVVEHSGKVRSFDTDDAERADVVLDLTDRVKLNAPPHFEAGLNAIALDPE